MHIFLNVLAFYPHWDNAFAQKKTMVVPALLFYITFPQVWQKMYLKFLSSGNYVLDTYRMAFECELYKKTISREKLKIYYLLSLLFCIYILIFIIY